MDQLDLIIIAALVLFLVLAVALLYPVHRFLKREEHHSKRWTRETHQEGGPSMN